MQTFMTDNPSENLPHHSARPRCLACKKRFTPDPRVGPRQKYCSNKKCQARRQRLHETTWLEKPENTKFRVAYQRRWREDNPDYLEGWRQKHPQAVRRNREFMREHMRRKRSQPLFEKTRQWRLEVVKDKGDMYVNRMNTWVLLRLRRQGIWSKALSMGYACGRTRSEPVRLPKGRLYKVSGGAP